MSMKNERTASVILPAEVRERVNSAILQLGEMTVTRRMHVNGATLARACAGWPIQRGSALQIQAGLEAL